MHVDWERMQKLDNARQPRGIVMYTLVWDKQGFDVRQETQSLAPQGTSPELSGVTSSGTCSVSYADWARFMRTGKCDARDINHALKDSWTRCRELAVDPGPRKCWNFLPLENLEPSVSRLRSLTRFDLGSIKAYILKLGMQFVYCAENRQEAEILLKSWHRRAVRSKVDRIVKLAKTVKEHWQGILSYFASRLTNGFLEGINSLVQAAKTKARGYRNPDNLIAMAYLIAGKLKFPQPT